MFKKLVPAVIWFGITIWLFTLPGSAIPSNDWFDKLFVDKWVHISLFLLLCVLWMLPFKQKRNATTIFLIVAFFAVLYGIAVEFVQRDYIPNRSFDVWDISADSVGVIIALFYMLKTKKKN